jgi:hypothetical protein
MTYIIALILWLGVALWVTRDLRGTRPATVRVRPYNWEVDGL